MSLIIFAALFVVALIIFIVAGVYATRGATASTRISGYSTDENLQRAHANLKKAAVITWITVGLGVILVVLGVVAGVFFAPEEAAAAAEASLNPMTSKATWGLAELAVGGLALVIAALAFAVGVMGAIAATSLQKSQNKNGQYETAYRDAIITAVAGIGGIGFIIVGFIGYYIVKEQSKRRAQVRYQKEQAYKKQLLLEIAEARHRNARA